MKKHRLIAAVLSIALLLIGASYAVWSDTLILDHNVTTGTLDVDWQPDAEYVGAFLDYAPDVNIPVDPSCTVNLEYPVDEPETLKFTINNMYPGVRAYYYAWQQNMGTLPAKFGSVTVDTSGSSLGAESNIIYFTNIYIYHSLTDEYEWIYNYLGNVDGVEAFLNTILAGKILYPGDSIISTGDMEGTLAYFLLPIGALDDVQGQFLNFDITFTWVQP
jgi:hypothetical protein